MPDPEEESESEEIKEIKPNEKASTPIKSPRSYEPLSTTDEESPNSSEQSSSDTPDEEKETAVASRPNAIVPTNGPKMSAFGLVSLAQQ